VGFLGNIDFKFKIYLRQIFTIQALNSLMFFYTDGKINSYNLLEIMVTLKKMKKRLLNESFWKKVKCESNTKGQ
jgi:hypothetical protein